MFIHFTFELKVCRWVFGCISTNLYLTLCLGFITIDLNSHNIQVVGVQLLNFFLQCHELVNLCVLKLNIWGGGG